MAVSTAETFLHALTKIFVPDLYYKLA